jgi:hypothetical protein
MIRMTAAQPLVCEGRRPSQGLANGREESHAKTPGQGHWLTARGPSGACREDVARAPDLLGQWGRANVLTRPPRCDSCGTTPEGFKERIYRAAMFEWASIEYDCRDIEKFGNTI